MTTHFITDANLTALLDSLAKEEQVLTCRTAPDSDHVLYAPHEQGDAFEYTGFRPAPALKGLLFPPQEKVGEYPAASAEAPEPAAPPVVVGPANCDLRALASLDAVLMADDFRDGFYAGRREKLFVITQDCTNPRPTCACTWLGLKPYPEEGFDLNLSQVSGGYVIEVGSEKAGELLDSHPSLVEEATKEALGERDDRRAEAEKALEQINEEYALGMTRRELLALGDAAEAWPANVSTCVECAACLFACPTCHCFLLYDQKAGDKNERVRVWDACSYGGYSRMAGGGSPRPLLIDRFRHRFMHKFDYFPENNGFEMCSGCGRCIEGCAGNIDMRKLFKALESSVSANASDS